MEHLYSRNSFNALQNYYQSMLIAHLLNQLLEHTCKIHDLLKRFNKLTIKYLWQQLACHHEIPGAMRTDPGGN